MRDVELYQAVLGLQAPWTVVNVEPYACSECREPVPRYDRKRRGWRHLDTCQFTTWIQADVPRVNCPTFICRLSYRSALGANTALTPPEFPVQGVPFSENSRRNGGILLPETGSGGSSPTSQKYRAVL